jgi:hypothetical protein
LAQAQTSPLAQIKKHTPSSCDEPFRSRTLVEIIPEKSLLG